MKTKKSYTEPLVIRHSELRDITAQSGSMKNSDKTWEKPLLEKFPGEKILEIPGTM